MKTRFDRYGGFEFIAEEDNGRDILWLNEFCKNIPSSDRKKLSEYIQVCMEDGCVDENGNQMNYVSLEDIFSESDDTEPWGDIVSIEFNPIGF